MAVFLCPHRVPVAIFVSGRPVVLDATLQLSVWLFKSRPAWPTFLPYAPLTTSQHTWLVIQPLSASRLAMSRVSSPPPLVEMSSSPVAESWCYTQVRGGVVCGSICDWLHNRIYPLGYLLYFQDFNKCQFHSNSSLFCCCWSNKQLLLNAMWDILLATWDFLLGLKVELTHFAHQSLFTGLGE